MKRTNKRLLGVQSQEKGLLLPPLNTVEFSARLQDLLSKVSVQNRYAQRISQCNIKNMEELQRAKQELQRIAEQRKLKQLRAGNDQDLLEQLSRRANTSEQQLKNVFKELVDAKREIKALKKEISNLQKSNLQLQSKIMEMKRERYYQISAAKEEVENSLLVTEIKRYLSASDKVSSVLYQYSLAAYKVNDFSNFLINLERKLQEFAGLKRFQPEPYYKGTSGLKLRLSRGRNDRRFKTEHVSHQKVKL